MARRQDDDGWTAAHYAVYYSRAEILFLLLRSGASPGARTAAPARTTLLHLAAGCGARGCAYLLLRCGADPHARDGDGATPAQLAASLRPDGHEALACTLAIARYLRPEPTGLCGGPESGGHPSCFAERLVPRTPMRLTLE